MVAQKNTSICPFVFDEATMSRYNAGLLGQLAQLVEQRIENPRVRGSIPRLATNSKSPNSFRAFSHLPYTPALAGLRRFASPQGDDTARRGGLKPGREIT